MDRCPDASFVNEFLLHTIVASVWMFLFHMYHVRISVRLIIQNVGTQVTKHPQRARASVTILAIILLNCIPQHEVSHVYKFPSEL
jgi:hypothetical protein